MRAVIQRVSHASVKVDGKEVGKIGNGLLILLGVEEGDEESAAEWLMSKIYSLRIFNDEKGLMNLSVDEVGGDVLMISQFTLLAATKKGARPSFIRAAKPQVASPMFDKAVIIMESMLGKKVEKGMFGADMKVELLNDGPVTIFIDTNHKE